MAGHGGAVCPKASRISNVTRTGVEPQLSSPADKPKPAEGRGKGVDYFPTRRSDRLHSSRNRNDAAVAVCC